MNFSVGIVLYNCDINKIENVIDEYKKVARKIILIDNSSENIDDIDEMVKKSNRIKLIKNSKNKGIATALNQILKEAYEINSEYLLTLDQDSFLQYNDLKKMYQYFRKDVAIVCPEVLDLNKKKNKTMKNEYEVITRCITSGSFMNLEICKNVGFFDEKMFIDYVDFDYSKRIQMFEYKILRIKNCFLNHEIGRRTVRKFLWIYVYPTNHSAFRVYYYFRNMHYYYLKFRKHMTLKEKLNEIIRITWKYISIILYEENKENKLENARKGFEDAKKMFK